jgi:hypothetical protein
LGLIGAGPVGLIRTQKFQFFKTKNPLLRSKAKRRVAMARILRSEQREVDHIQRMVGSVGYRDSKGGTKAHAVFRSLDSNAVVTVFHDYLSCRIRIKPPEGASPVAGQR